MYSGKIAVPPGGGGIGDVSLFCFCFFCRFNKEKARKEIVTSPQKGNNWTIVLFSTENIAGPKSLHYLLELIIT
jgi:hypothetical protein